MSSYNAFKTCNCQTKRIDNACTNRVCLVEPKCKKYSLKEIDIIAL